MNASLQENVAPRVWRVSAIAIATCLAADAIGLVRAGTPVPQSVRFEERFEDVSDWSGLESESSNVREGSAAAAWSDTVTVDEIERVFSIPQDWSGDQALGFWMHSQTANEAGIQIVLRSNNPSTPGPDYFTSELIVDWTGWRWVWITPSELHPVRQPLGWHHITAIELHADGWGHTPRSDTHLVLDRMVVTRAILDSIARQSAWYGNAYIYRFHLDLEGRGDVPSQVELGVDAPPEATVHGLPRTIALQPGETKRVTLDVSMTWDAFTAGPYADRGMLIRLVGSAASEPESLEEYRERIPNPGFPQSSPRTLLTQADFTRMNTWAVNHGWAATRRNEILERATSWRRRFLEDYGLTEFQLPPRGGQWSQHYVCPQHALKLVHTPPLIHTCPLDGHVLHGWPYDQVIFGRAHDDLAKAARDAGLAYGFTHDLEAAGDARELLLAYAAAYGTYPLQDVRGDGGVNGARIHAQTLNEAEWLFLIAWAYDLIAASPVLSVSEHLDIQQLVRRSAATLQRNQGGAPNWQSQHSAALAAAGRAIDAPAMVASALHRRRGFFRQLEENVHSDGFWNEGSWGYHFKALEHLTYLAEMGERGGFPLYSEPKLQSMYTAPLQFAMPDFTLPAFNDSPVEELADSDVWQLEAGFRAYGDPLLTAPLHSAARDEEALFFGAETLSANVGLPTASTVFPGSGYSLLRGGTPADPWYLALDYGDHGGWHGHFDKLGFAFYARGRMLGLDPGRHSYASPLHDSWDRTTVAHNTVVVDERNQAESEGELLEFSSLDGVSMTRAAVGGAYEGVDLSRTLVMTGDYVLDTFTATSIDGRPHTYDWFYHNPGPLTSFTPGTPFAGFPDVPGYKHLTEVESFSTNADALFEFEFPTESTYPGTLWENDPSIRASSDYSRQVAARGEWANRLTYDFPTNQSGGYILYGTRLLDEYAEAPTAAAVWIHGLASNNKARVRIVDATGEVFRSGYVTLFFNHWRRFNFPIDESWTSSGGNDDGIMDVPLKRLVFQLRNEPGGRDAGYLHVDHWTLDFPSSGEVSVEDPEALLARERLTIMGAPETTYFSGQGLGPDLQLPVPFVMARRSGLAATFDVLHEPLESQEGVTLFEKQEGCTAVAYRVGGGDFEDLVILAREEGAGLHRTGAWASDADFTWIRRNEAHEVTRVVLFGGTRVLFEDRVVLEVPSGAARVSARLVNGSIDQLKSAGP